ncbi:hypothetical protein [Roseibium sp. M-1]
MSIHRALLAAAALLLSGATAYSGSDAPEVGDTYIISRDGQTFRGSHRIYDRSHDGLVAVEYCGRSYWVRYATVAWTQLEVEQEYTVRVEFNWGKGWRPICDHPEQQVTLEGLGVIDDPRIVVQNDGTSLQKVNRFSVIREAFRTTGEEVAKTYHRN